AIEQGTDGSYSAYIADKDCEFGCIGEGKTMDEAKADFHEAVEDMKAVYAEEGKAFPKVEFEFC
ncbi:MAG: DNA-binding protein, partial [Bacteroidaceae bacterium]|nr:DNA-binding protein [Bacteroidaceae bacterium]